MVMAYSIYAKAQAPTNGLVAYYGFENNANSHNGLYNLTNLHTSGTQITYPNGGNGTGNTAYFNNTALKTTAISPQITNTFTICFWQKNDAAQAQINATRFEMFGSAFYRNSGSPGQYARGQISISNGSWVGSLVDTALSNNTWQHIAITYASNGSFTRWVNGVYDFTLDTNVGFANLIKYNQILSIGGGADGAGTFMNSKGFTGYIDEFYVYDRALTSSEINQVKNDLDGIPSGSAVVSSDVLFLNSNAEITNVLNANNLNTTVSLNWGNTASTLTNQVALGTISGSSNTSIVTNLTGLTSGNTYYYQLVFTSSLGISKSNIYSFTQSVIDAFRFNNSFLSENGTLYLGPGPSGIYPNFVTDRSGNANSAVFLENYKALVSGNIPTLPSAGSKRSVSFWFKRARTVPAEHHSIFVWGTETATNAYGVTINNDNTVTNFGWQADETSQTASALTTNWDHYVVTYSDTKVVCIYKNGVLIRTGSQNWNTIGSVLTLGSKTSGGLTNIYGYLDDFELYNTTLSQAQVNNLFTNGTAVLSTQNFAPKNLKTIIYPNPTSENFTVEMKKNIKSVEIYSLQGQKVLTSNSKKVNVSKLSKGIYLVRVMDVDGAVITQKLIVE